jgi:hypothetical protein
MWTRRYIEDRASDYSDDEKLRKAFIDGCEYILRNTQINNYLK